MRDVRLLVPELYFGTANSPTPLSELLHVTFESITLASLDVTKEKGLVFLQHGEGVANNQAAITEVLNSVKAEK